jgi:transposase InsO family protein
LFQWAKRLLELIYEFDAPRILHSDNGGEFVNKIIKRIAKVMGIKLVNGGPYQPQQQVMNKIIEN